MFGMMNTIHREHPVAFSGYFKQTFFWYFGAFRNCAFFYEGGTGGIVTHLFSMVSFFVCACSHRLGVSAIYNPGLNKFLINMIFPKLL